MKKRVDIMTTSHGFSIVELMIVVIIMGVVSSLAIPSVRETIRGHKLTQNGKSIEYLVRYAKIMSMERTTNIGVCVNDSKTLTLYDLGTDRSAGVCSGTSIMNMTVPDTDASGYSISLSGSGASLDPRGLAIQTGNGCVSNGITYYNVVVNRTGVSVDSKAGPCP